MLVWEDVDTTMTCVIVDKGKGVFAVAKRDDTWLAEIRMDKLERFIAAFSK